jgi:Cu/Ag efflux protein CusF
MDHGAMEHGAEGVHAPATINSIEGDTVNVTHGPIPEIGWPAMTMDLQLLDGAEVGPVAAGDEAVMMLEKGPDGLYGIRALMPAE